MYTFRVNNTIILLHEMKSADGKTITPIKVPLSDRTITIGSGFNKVLENLKSADRTSYSERVQVLPELFVREINELFDTKINIMEELYDCFFKIECASTRQGLDGKFFIEIFLEKIFLHEKYYVDALLEVTGIESDKTNNVRANNRDLSDESKFIVFFMVYKYTQFVFKQYCLSFVKIKAGL